MLGVFAADVHLDTKLKLGHLWRALLRQALRHVESIHALHPIEMFGNEAGFVALDRADEMPDQRVLGCTQMLTYREHLRHAFLRIVLAKDPLAAPHRLHDSVGGEGLGYRDELNIFGMPAGR